MISREEMDGILCPACDHENPEKFYRVDGIPVHSCLLQDTMQAARGFPSADLELGVCRQCAFITNVRFDECWMAYAPEYEDQQSFSPTFNRFARDLATKLIGRYELHGRDIIEIGCGKGDFLRLLCEMGGNSGVGIDPSVAPQRHTADPTSEILWVPEYFSGRHADLPADFICCRHTLEHVSAVGEFVQTLREVIGDRPIPVFFEVPDSMRVLKQCAFEDIYYEHCSYFTPGSLARLFSRCGFEVSDLYRAYDDQYLLLEAMPVDAAANAVPALAESMDETLAAVSAFRGGVEAKVKFWQGQLDRMRGQRLAIWGSGSKCVAFLSSLDVNLDSVCVVDINSHRQGKFIPGSGLEIKAPEFLRGFRPGRVIAMNRIYEEEIGRMLERLEITAELSAL